MKKSVTLDGEAVATWQEAFKLNFHWGKSVPSIIAATLALNTLNDLVPSGYYLAKQKLEVSHLPSLGQALVLNGYYTKKLTSFICHSDVVYLGETIMSMSSVLIRPEAEPVVNNLKGSSGTHVNDNCRSWRTFTREEVKAFASLSGDTNNLHSGDYPVVQGMLILLAVEDYLASANIFFRDINIFYHKPVRIDVPVKIHTDEKNLYGIADDSVCFQINFQEEK